MTPPRATHDYTPGGLDAALEFLKRTRSELRSLRTVRVWTDRLLRRRRRAGRDDAGAAAGAARRAGHPARGAPDVRARLPRRHDPSGAPGNPRRHRPGGSAPPAAARQDVRPNVAGRYHAHV